jgi:hypothetical protein
MTLIDFLLNLCGMAENVILEVLPGLEALTGECPEESTRADPVGLHKVVVDQALVHILDHLKD